MKTPKPDTTTDANALVPPAAAGSTAPSADATLESLIQTAREWRLRPEMRIEAYGMWEVRIDKMEVVTDDGRDALVYFDEPYRIKKLSDDLPTALSRALTVYARMVEATGDRSDVALKP